MRGPNVFFEYWGNAAATGEALRDGWYHSGDIGTRDADGYFIIHDRKKNMIISGGENIYPAEVERVLHRASRRRRSGRDRPRRSEMAGGAGRLCGARAQARADRAPTRSMRHRRPASSRASRCRASRVRRRLPRNALGKVQHFRLKERTQPTA